MHNGHFFLGTRLLKLLWSDTERYGMCARGLACENVRMIEENNDKKNDNEEGQGKGERENVIFF